MLMKLCLLQVDRCWVVGANGSSVDLTPSLDGATSVVPTFAPTLMERAISTRATTSAPERRQRSVQVLLLGWSLQSAGSITADLLRAHPGKHVGPERRPHSVEVLHFGSRHELLAASSSHGQSLPCRLAVGGARPVERGAAVPDILEGVLTLPAVVQEVTVQFSLCVEPWMQCTMHLTADQGLQSLQILLSRPGHDRLLTMQVVLQEVTVQFNLCMEPWLKYAMHLVADQGLRRQLWTSSRLLQEVLFLETHRCCLTLEALARE